MERYWTHTTSTIQCPQQFAIRRMQATATTIHCRACSSTVHSPSSAVTSGVTARAVLWDAEEHSSTSDLS